jgi:hypothetical protein
MRYLISVLLSVLFSSQAFGVVLIQRTGGGEEPPAWGVGNLLSERFTGTGTEETWSSPNTENGIWNADDTTYSGIGNGFEGDHLTVSGTSNWQANATIDLGAAQSAVYFRLFLRVNSEDYADGGSERIFNIVPDGGLIGNDSGIGLVLYQDAGVFYLWMNYNGGASLTTGSGHLAIDTGTIYKVEGKFVDNGDNDEIEWRVNDVSIGSRGGARVSGLALRDVYIGMSYGPGASISFDTLDISSTGYPDE